MEFSAGQQALGYIYQVLCALDLLLSNQDETVEVFIESLDDIVFANDGTPRELLQLKHHCTPVPLTDTSNDLWKTIRVWSIHLHEGKLRLPGTLLTLITTEQSPDNSIAALLRPGFVNHRDSQKACHRLYDIAISSSNRGLKPAFDAFTSLSQEQRAMLADAIQVIDTYPNIVHVVDSIKFHIRFSVRPEYLEGLYHRLEGWWFDKMVRHLHENSIHPVTGLEVHLKIADIAEQFRSDSLPIDFSAAFPRIPSDPEQDTRLFVQQLREIALKNDRIKKAIVDYYRAFEQRSRWVREELLVSDELEQYETKLVDEWERHFLAIENEL